MAILVEISVLDLKLHKDTDSPFAIRQDANDNWQEIMDYSTEVKTAVDELAAGMGELTPEAIKEIIRELLVSSKIQYTIPSNMVNGESITLPDGNILVRSNNTYSISIPDADKRIVQVKDVSDMSIVQPVVTTTATEIKLYFDLPIVNNMIVLLM